MIKTDPLMSEGNLSPLPFLFGADPFEGDPFKGTDPFAVDSFFAQTSEVAFSTEDPFSAPADPFGTTPGIPEPDLFASKLNDAASGQAADPFVSKDSNPPLAPKDPFSSAQNQGNAADPFKASPVEGETDPFASQDGGSDPFSSSPPSSELTVVSGSALVPDLIQIWPLDPKHCFKIRNLVLKNL